MLISRGRQFFTAFAFVPPLLLLSAFPLHSRNTPATKSSAQSSQSAQAPPPSQSPQASPSRQPTEALSPKAKDEAEIRHEQRFLEPDTPERQYSIINSETPGTNGKTSDCTPKERAAATAGYIGCYLTFTRNGKRESHHVLRPTRFPESYFVKVNNSIGMWEEMKDGMVQYFTLHTDGRVEIGAKVRSPHSVQ
jgi:hypothetical protein